MFIDFLTSSQDCLHEAISPGKLRIKSASGLGLPFS